MQGTPGGGLKRHQVKLLQWQSRPPPPAPTAILVPGQKTLASAPASLNAPAAASTSSGTRRPKATKRVLCIRVKSSRLRSRLGLA